MTLPEQSNIQGLRMLCGGLGYVVGVVWTGWHWRVWPFWTLGGLMTVVTLLGGFAPNVPVLAVAIGLGGVAMAMCNQMSLYYAIGSGVVKRGRGAGLTESALALGGGAGPLLGGVAASLMGSPRGALFATLVPLAGCALIWSRALPRRSP
jgi:predicted MFS family arabinose efflux permease